jgi:intein-encoded DNA endonuclease-like protein
MRCSSRSLNIDAPCYCVVSVRPRGLRKVPPFEVRAQLYKTVRVLGNRGQSPTEIREEIESKSGRKISLDTIKGWISDNHSPYGRVYRLPEEPIPELAYIIGVNFGDTSRSKNWRRNYTIRIRVKDEDFAREFARAASVVLRRRCKVWFDLKRGLWQTDVLSIMLYKLVTRPLSELEATITPVSIALRHLSGVSSTRKVLPARTR